jgi:hypothetical protein
MILFKGIGQIKKKLFLEATVLSKIKAILVVKVI